MNRLLPKTLFGRMVLIMVTGLVVAQFLSMAIFFQEREHQNLRSTARHFGVRIGEIVKIMTACRPRSARQSPHRSAAPILLSAKRQPNQAAARSRTRSRRRLSLPDCAVISMRRGSSGYRLPTTQGTPLA